MSVKESPMEKVTVKPGKFVVPQNYSLEEISDNIDPWLEDLEDEDVEIWIMQTPPSVNLSAIQGQMMKLDGTSFFDYEGHIGNKLESSIIDSSESLHCNLIAPSKEDKQFHVVKKPFAGHILLTESFDVPECQIPLASGFDRSDRPEQPRQRFLPFGSHSVREIKSSKSKKKKKSKEKSKSSKHESSAISFLSSDGEEELSQYIQDVCTSAIDNLNTNDDMLATHESSRIQSQSQDNIVLDKDLSMNESGAASGFEADGLDAHKKKKKKKKRVPSPEPEIQSETPFKDGSSDKKKKKKHKANAASSDVNESEQSSEDFHSNHISTSEIKNENKSQDFSSTELLESNTSLNEASVRSSLKKKKKKKESPENRSSIKKKVNKGTVSSTSSTDTEFAHPNITKIHATIKQEPLSPVSSRLAGNLDSNESHHGHKKEKKKKISHEAYPPEKDSSSKKKKKKNKEKNVFTSSSDAECVQPDIERILNLIKQEPLSPVSVRHSADLSSNDQSDKRDKVSSKKKKKRKDIPSESCYESASNYAFKDYDTVSDEPNFHAMVKKEAAEYSSEDLVTKKKKKKMKIKEELFSPQKHSSSHKSYNLYPSNESVDPAVVVNEEIYGYNSESNGNADWSSSKKQSKKEHLNSSVSQVVVQPKVYELKEASLKKAKSARKDKWKKISIKNEMLSP